MTPPEAPDRASQRPPEIDFVVAGGGSTGLGHIARSAALARAARGRGWHVRAYLNGDEPAFEAWRRRAGFVADGGWSAWRPDVAPRVVALDHPLPKEDWLRRLTGAGHHGLLIDDPRGVARARWLLLPGLHHDHVQRPPTPSHVPDRKSRRTTVRLLVGARYAILPDGHRRRTPRPLSGRDRVLVSLGGSDPHHATPQVARALRDAIDAMPSPGATRAIDAMPSTDALPGRIGGVDVVLGPSFADPDGGIAREIARLGFRVRRGVESEAMAGLMSRARLAVVGFGTSLTELAWHGTPFVCVTHHTSDLAPAAALARAGLGRVLGDAPRLDPHAMTAALLAALEDGAWRSRSSALGRAAIGDGRGAERVLSAIEAELEPRLECASQGAGDARSPVSRGAGAAEV